MLNNGYCLTTEPIPVLNFLVALFWGNEDSGKSFIVDSGSAFP